IFRSARSFGSPGRTGFDFSTGKSQTICAKSAKQSRSRRACSMRREKWMRTFSLEHWANRFWWMPRRVFERNSAPGWSATSSPMTLKFKTSPINSRCFTFSHRNHQQQKMSGQTTTRLCGLIPLDNVPLQPTIKLAAPSIEGKEVGWITSATHSERMGKEIALGYVKRGFNSVGTKLDALVAADFAAQKPNT